MQVTRKQTSRSFRCHTKRRMGVHGPANCSFGKTPTFRKYNLLCQRSQILKSRCHAKRRMGVVTRAHPSFGMTTTKTLRSIFSWRASDVNPFHPLITHTLIAECAKFMVASPDILSGEFSVLCRTFWIIAGHLTGKSLVNIKLFAGDPFAGHFRWFTLLLDKMSGEGF